MGDLGFVAVSLIVVGSTLIIAPKVWKYGKNIFRKGITNAFLVYSGARSNYRWRLRVKTPDFLRHMGDYVFQLDNNAGSESPDAAAADKSFNCAEQTFSRKYICTHASATLMPVVRSP